VELDAALAGLLDALRRDEVPIPAVYGSSMVLGVRWRARLTGQLTEAIDSLRSGAGTSV
jgi:hypothetical protein